MTKTRKRTLAYALVGAIAYGAVSLVANAAAESEPTPGWVQVDAGPEAGAAAEVPGPVAEPGPIDPEKDPEGYAKQLYETVRKGEALPIVALLLVAFVAGVRRWGTRWLPFLGTDRGGVLLLFGSSLLGLLATSLYAGVTPDLRAVATMLVAAATAAGGYQAFKRLLWPKDGEPES